MLSKVDAGTVSAVNLIENRLQNVSVSGASSLNVLIWPNNYQYWSVSFSGSFLKQLNSWWGGAWGYFVGSTQTKLWDASDIQQTKTVSDINLPVNTYFWFYNTNESSWRPTTLKLVDVTVYLSAHINISKISNIVGKPRELKNIGNKASTTIFGLHTDRTRITQETE